MENNWPQPVEHEELCTKLAGNKFKLSCNCGADRANAMLDACKKSLDGNTGKVTGETSDGYHTFNELYDHRCLLWINYCLTNPDKTYLVENHFDGWFLLGKETSYGQISYHCPNKYVELVKSIERRHPEFDGHSGNSVLVRLAHLANFGQNPPRAGLSFEPDEIETLNGVEYVMKAKVDAYLKGWFTPTKMAASEMRTEYDFSKMKGRHNPYVASLPKMAVPTLDEMEKVAEAAIREYKVMEVHTMSETRYIVEAIHEMVEKGKA